MSAPSNNIPRIHCWWRVPGVGCLVPDVGWSVSGVRCRLWHWSWPCSGPALTPLLTPLLAPPCPGLTARAPRICTHPPRGSARTSCRPWHPHAPRVHLAPPVPHCTVIARPGTPWGGPWGSLLAAPVGTCTGYVPCPLKQAPLAPLIGTQLPAPGVTVNGAITGREAKLALLWSTFYINAIMAKETPARACLIAIMAHLAPIMAVIDPLHPYPIYYSY